MGGAKTYTPYPTFQKTSPHPSSTGFLSTVGRCRIYPKSCCNVSTDEFNAIVQKTIDQSLVPPANKKLTKQYMKEGIAMASSYLSITLGLDTSIVDVELVISTKTIVESDGCIVSCFLDAGCDAIVVRVDDVSDETKTGLECMLQALEVCRVPKERLVVQVDNYDTLLESRSLELSPGYDLAGVAEYASTVSVNLKFDSLDGPILDSPINEQIHNLINSQPGLFSRVILELPSSVTTTAPTTTGTTTSKHIFEQKNTILTQTVSSIATLSSTTTSHIPHGIHLTLTDPNATTLGHAYTASLRTDRPDKLYTTVVATRSNEALGLVYSSGESIVAALQTGRGVYYSRSRGGLWRKGDTSGNYQTLHRIDVDCDGDALRFMVTQRGDNPAFCHLETLTCWGKPNGVRDLESTLSARLVDAPAGSYTNRLFDDSQLLRDKLVEEAQELAEAETPQHIAEELADVLYFAMVKAAKAGVGLDDAVKVLDARRRKVTRRKGDSKVERIEAGDAILKKKRKGEE